MVEVVRLPEARSRRVLRLVGDHQGGRRGLGFRRQEARVMKWVMSVVVSGPGG